MNKIGYNLRFIIVIILLFILITIGLYFGGVFLTKKYPRIETSDSLKDTVSQVISDGRGSARITSTSNKKFTLPWAKIFEHGQEVSLTRAVTEGDILLKKEFSDTIVLIHNEKKYTFVANRTITED